MTDTMSRDIVVTWPKSRSLESYLESVAQAARDGLWINFRVPTLPSQMPNRCYRVHDGAIHGYMPVLDCLERGDREVRIVGGDGYWPAGKYIVCSPYWYSLAEPVAMRGFQGWRWLRWERPD